MEIIIHPANKRGSADHGWLKTNHSFSFAQWYEPTRMGFGALRVLNDDVIAPKTGFGAHPHRDMEIITIVTQGTVTHTDSMGNKGTVAEGDVQVMSAGTGVVHSEENMSADEALALFQLWIEPKSKGIEPRYAQQTIGFKTISHALTLLVAPDDHAEGLPIHQDAYIYWVALKEGEPIEYTLHDPTHGIYLFVIEGVIDVGGTSVSTRDAAGITCANEISFKASAGAQALLIEVPMK